MAELNWRENPAAVVRVLQIIVAAMVAGLMLFLAIAVFMPTNQPEGEPILTYIAAGFAALAVLARLAVPRAVVAQGRRKVVQQLATESSSDSASTSGDIENKIAALLMTKTIIGAAILEGATLFLLIAHLVEKSPITLGLAVALIVSMALQLPTQSSAADWIDNQRRLIEEERAFVR